MEHPSREEIQSLLDLSEKELLTLIGESRPIALLRPPPPPPMILPPIQIPELWVIAQNWFNLSEIIFYGRLCVQKRICKKLENPGFDDDVSIVLAAGDIIASLITGIPPFQVAAFLVKSGIKKFCHCGKRIDAKRKNSYLFEAEYQVRYLKSRLQKLEGEENQQNTGEILRIKEMISVLEDVRRSLSPKSRRKD